MSEKMTALEALEILTDNPYNDKAHIEVYQALEQFERLKELCEQALDDGILVDWVEDEMRTILCKKGE